MLPKAIFVAVALSSLVLAIPKGPPAKRPPAAPATPAPVPISKCNTGNVQCCNKTASVNDPATAKLAGLLGLVIHDIAPLVGLECSPAGNVIGANCAQQPVCCQDTKFDGLINVGCIPISP